MRKAIICIGLVLLMTIGMCVGCASNNTATTSASTAPSVSASTAATTAASESAAATTAASTSTKHYKIGFMIGDETMAFFLNMEKGAKAEVKQGDNIICLAYDDDANKQTQLFDDLLAQKVDIIVSSLFDPNAAVASLKKCQAAGVPIVLLDSYPDGTDNAGLFKAAVLDDLKDAGYQQGTALCKAINGSGNFGMIWIPGLSAITNARVDGFKEALKAYPNVKLAAYQEGGVDTDSCQKEVAAQLQVHPEINAYYAPWANAGEAAVNALAAAKMTNVKLGVGDIDASMAQNILDGKITCCTDLNSVGMGKQAIDIAYQILAGQTVSTQLNYVKTTLVDKTTAANYISK